MKQLYALVFFLIVYVGYGQDAKTTGEIAGFKLYPNPVTNGKVFIATKDDAAKKIFIFDVLGTQVLQSDLIGQELNVSALDAGVYVLRVIEKDKTATRKLIIK